MHTPLITKVLLFVFLLATASSQVQQMIRQAIRESILDGLNMIDKTMRSEYWYYIENADLVAYNVTDEPRALNYIIIYANPTNLYKVDANVIKATWTVSLNSLVQIVDHPLVPKEIREALPFVNPEQTLKKLTTEATQKLFQQLTDSRRPNQAILLNEEENESEQIEGQAEPVTEQSSTVLPPGVSARPQTVEPAPPLPQSPSLTSQSP